MKDLRILSRQLTYSEQSCRKRDVNLLILKIVVNIVHLHVAYSRVHNSPPFGLFMKQNAYVPVGRNDGGGEATPTSISIFNSHDMKTL